MSPRRVGAALLAAGALLAATACVQQSGVPSDCDASQVERAATLTDSGLAPSAIDVCLGQLVTLTIDVQRTGGLKLTGYEDLVAMLEVTRGDNAQLAFTASRAGRFVVELRVGRYPVPLGVLTVHER